MDKNENFKVGKKYCRTLLEVDAIQVWRDNLDDLLKFTGNGTMSIPKNEKGIYRYSFVNTCGTFFDVPEKWYIIKDKSGHISTIPNYIFEKDFELKININPISDNTEKIKNKELQDLIDTLAWIIRKHHKGDCDKEIVRMLLLHEDEIKKYSTYEICI